MGLSENKTDHMENSLVSNYQYLLEQIGENPYREGLLKTPERASKAMLHLTKGYSENLTGKYI